MGDTEPVHSVRGKGWVKFDEDGDDVSTSTASTRRMSAAEDSPGSLEVGTKLCLTHRPASTEIRD